MISDWFASSADPAFHKAEKHVAFSVSGAWMPRIIDGAAQLPIKSKAVKAYALVDLEDYDRVRSAAPSWRLAMNGRSSYARATSAKNLPRQHMWLHRFILRTTPDQLVDHINGNGLDNRKCNLRICSSAENARNSRVCEHPTKTSRFKGVFYSATSDKWVAHITFEGIPQGLGSFDDEEDAARCYDAAALRLFGEFARTNEMMRLYPGQEPLPDMKVTGCGYMPRRRDLRGPDARI